MIEFCFYSWIHNMMWHIVIETHRVLPSEHDKQAGKQNNPCPLPGTVHHCPSLPSTVHHCPSLSITGHSLSIAVRHCPSLPCVNHCLSLSWMVCHFASNVVRIEKSIELYNGVAPTRLCSFESAPNRSSSQDVIPSFLHH